MAATLGEWRRGRSSCSGALLWTLNDVLPGAGWGVLDHRGEPKAAYWYVRRALAPVAVWMTDEGTNGVAVHVANDAAAELVATLELALYRPDGLVVADGAAPLRLSPRSVDELSVEAVVGRFVDAGYAYRFGPSEHDVVVATLRATDGTVVSRAFHFPTGHPVQPRTPAEVGLEAHAGALGGARRVTLRSTGLAYGVQIAADGWRPEDNWFSLPPQAEKSVLLMPSGAEAAWPGCTVSAANLPGRLRAREEGS